MLVSGLPTVVIASVIVHNTNADHAYYNWDITRCRKSECKIGIDGIPRGVEAHPPHRVPGDGVPVRAVIRQPGSRDNHPSGKPLVNIIRSYAHERDPGPEQPARCAEQEH